MSSDMAIKAKRLINKKVWKIDKYYDSDEHTKRYQYLSKKSIKILGNYPLSHFDIEIISKFEDLQLEDFNHPIDKLPPNIKKLYINCDVFNCEINSLDYLPICLEQLILARCEYNINLYNLPPNVKYICICQYLMDRKEININIYYPMLSITQVYGTDGYFKCIKWGNN